MIKRHYIKLHTPEWYEFRKNGIGASEVASVMATESKILNDQIWTPPIKLFLSKVGEPVQEFTGNQSSESGQYEEPGIINRFRHYDLSNPDAMAMYSNIKRRIRLNKVIQPRVYVTNSRFPHLFASPDGLMYVDGKMVALVEAKLTNSFEAGTYANRVSPSFVLQCYQNMMLLELDKAYLCILIDGIYFEVITLQADDDIFRRMELCTAKFWKTVLEARIIKDSAGLESYYNINPSFLNETQLRGVEEIQKLEPSLTGTDMELEFIREICKPTPEFSEMIGTPDQWKLCVDYLSCGEKADQVKTDKQLITEHLIKSLSGTHVAKFDVNGKSLDFSFKPDKNGKTSIRVSQKILDAHKEQIANGSIM